jgi:hypothetical protein
VHLVSTSTKITFSRSFSQFVIRWRPLRLTVHQATSNSKGLFKWNAKDIPIVMQQSYHHLGFHFNLNKIYGKRRRNVFEAEKRDYDWGIPHSGKKFDSVLHNFQHNLPHVDGKLKSSHCLTQLAIKIDINEGSLHNLHCCQRSNLFIFHFEIL